MSSFNRPPVRPNDIFFTDHIVKPTWKGVVSRVSFIHYLIFVVANIVIWDSLYLDSLVDKGYTQIENYFLIVYALVIVYFFVCLIMVMIRRYHDAGLSAKVIFIPIKNIIDLFRPTKYLANPYAPELQQYFEQYMYDEGKANK